MIKEVCLLFALMAVAFAMPADLESSGPVAVEGSVKPFVYEVADNLESDGLETAESAWGGYGRGYGGGYGRGYGGGYGGGFGGGYGGGYGGGWGRGYGGRRHGWYG